MRTVTPNEIENEARRLLAINRLRNYRLLAHVLLAGCFLIPLFVWLAVIATHFWAR